MSNSIVGAKKKERKPRIAVDSAASISTAKLLYGLAEGEVYGLADGAKSIRLDGTPLVDDNGNGNFNGVRWTFAAGTNDQEHISGFPDVSNEVGVGVELKSSQPWIKAFNDTQLSAVRIRFKWDRLLETNPDNGDVNGYTIKYAIDLQTDGGAYHEIINTKIQEKTSAGYERTHRIDLPKAKTGWQLRVRRITPNSTSDLIQDTMMISAVAEVIDVKLSYPNTALLGIEYNAEIFSSIAKMSVRVKGKIIRVPDNYDPVARTYTGIWTGNFKDAYSNNPAWIFYDLCTQWRGGLGERLDATMIDRWSLYALGQYCDQPVSDGQGGLEPRFTCNVYLQKQEEAYTVLQNIAGIFRAMSFWTGEKIFVDADVPQDSIYTYSAANIVGGVAGIQYSGTRNRDRHTLAKVAWDNPNNDYQTEYEYVRDEKAMSKFGVKVLDLSAFGCTSQAQAQRAGLWALKTEQLETRQVTFSVGLDGAIPTVGNIISLSDEAFTGRANGGRVSTVNSTQRIIELDREVTASVGDVLIINGGSGKSERRNISNVVGNRITVTAGFTSAEPQHVWAIETADLKLMRFRVMSITENDDATYAITGIQHEPQKYDAIDFGTDVKPTDITIVNPDAVDAPASVTVTSRHREVQGQTVTTLIISWSQVTGAVAYDVEWRKDDGTWIKLPRTGNVSAEIDGVYSGNYMARVRAISAFDVQSNPTSSMLIEVKGKIGLPPTVVGLTATGILFGMDLKWGFQAGSGDAAFTEIQVGSAPNVNVATLTQVSYPTNTHTITGLQGNLSQSYRARIVDKLGFKSPWSAWVTGTTDASADKIMDMIQGQINESSLNQELTSKIGKIDANSSSISGINTEIEKAIADIIAADKVIAANKLETANAVAAANAELATAKTNIVEAKRIADLAKTDSAANKTTIASLTTTVGNNKTSVDSSITTLTNKDLALSNLYTAIKSEYDANKASVSQDLTALTNKDISLSSLLTALDTDYKGNKTAIRNELTAVSTKTDSTANSLTSLTTEVGNNKTAISTEATTRSTEDTALSNRITTISGKTDNALSRITTAETTIANNTGAIAQQKTDITTEYKQAIDDIEIGGRNLLLKSDVVLDTNNYLMNTYSLTQNIYIGDAIVVTVKGILGEGRDHFRIYDTTGRMVGNTTKVNENTHTLYRKSGRDLTGVRLYQDNPTGITSPSTVYSIKLEKGNKATDYTLAPEDTEADINAKISTESTARSSADTTLTNLITALDTDYKGNKAAIRNELTAVSDKTNSTASSLSSLSTTVDGNTTRITQESTARSDANTALGIRISATDAIATNAQSRVGTVETAVANNTQSIAQTKTDLKADFITSLGDLGTNNYYPKEYIAKADSWGTGSYKSLKRGIQLEPNTLYTFYVEKINSPNLVVIQLLNSTGTGATNNGQTIYHSGTHGYVINNFSRSFTTGDTGEINLNVYGATISLDTILYKPQIFKGKIKPEYTVSEQDYKDGLIKWRNYLPSEAMADSDNFSNAAYKRFKHVITLEPNTVYTFKIGKLSKFTNQIVPRILDATPLDYPTSIGGTLVGIFNRNGSEAEKDITRVFTSPTSGRISFEIYGASSFSKSIFDELQIYKGIEPVEWSPSFEDSTLLAEKNSAAITSESTARATAVGAVASTVGTLQTTVNGHTASIQTQQSSINGLNAQYTVKLDVGGRVSGFGIASSATQSDFAINADKFYIAPPTGSSKGTSPFMVLTSARTINGVSVPAGTYIQSAYIHNGSIDIAKINKASITSLDALTATIGHFKSAPSGARLEIKDSLLSVYDANNKLRVRLGLW